MKPTTPEANKELRGRILEKIHLNVRTAFFLENQKNMQFLTDDIMATITSDKQRLLKEADKKATQTAIDELEGILNCWGHPSLAPYFLTDRIAQLKVIQNKLEGLS